MTTITIRQRIGLAVAIVAVASLAGYGLMRHRGEAPLALYGNVDIRAVTLAFRVGGRVAVVDVDEGDAVRVGQELARLDPVPLELAAAEAREAAAAAAAHAQLLRSGLRVEDIAQAAATLAERRAALVLAEQQLVRQQELHGTGAVAQRAYDDAVAARDQARARAALAEAALASAQHGYRRQDVDEAAANARRAAAVAQRAEQQVADAVLRAPSAAIVTTRSIEPGAMVATGTPALTLTLPSPVWVRIYVDEANLARVAPGREVRVFTDSRPNRPYRGKIGFVSPTAEFTPKNVETPDLRTALVYRARVVITDADADLRQGMPVTVRMGSEGSAAERR